MFEAIPGKELPEKKRIVECARCGNAFISDTGKDKICGVCKRELKEGKDYQNRK